MTTRRFLTLLSCCLIGVLFLYAWAVSVAPL